MYRKVILAIACAATFAFSGLVTTDHCQAQRLRRPTQRVFYYYNGPVRAFTYATPVQRHRRPYYGPWAVGPYGPGYGYPTSYYSTYFPYHAPEGVYSVPQL